MKRLTSLAALGSLGLVAACAAKTQDPSPDPAPAPASTTSPAPPSSTAERSPPPAASATSSDPATNEVDANLKALRDLDVFDVQGIVPHIPEQANCYNIACAGHEQEFADAKARDAEALAAFTRKAVDAANSTAVESTPDYAQRCYTRDDENLAALKALDIVQIGDLREAPESYQAGNCYAVTRARKLARIAIALTKP